MNSNKIALLSITLLMGMVTQVNAKGITVVNGVKYTCNGNNMSTINGEVYCDGKKIAPDGQNDKSFFDKLKECFKVNTPTNTEITGDYVGGTNTVIVPKKVEEKTKTFKVGSDAQLLVENKAGNVTVIAKPGTKEITVKATKYCSDEKSKDCKALTSLYEQYGDKVEVKTKGKENSFFNWFNNSINIVGDSNVIVNNQVISTSSNNNYIKYDIEVPENMKSKDITIGSGDIKFKNGKADVTGKTGSGSILLDKIIGAINVTTGSGSINGSELKGGEIKAITGSGTVNIESYEPKNMHLSTGSGSVNLKLLASASATIKAYTGSGSINTSFILRNKNRTKHSLEGDINNGGPIIKIKTGSGSVNIDKI